MKLYAFRLICICGLCILSACTPSNSVTFSSKNGICPPSMGSGLPDNPYCVAITVNNNNNGQNLINVSNNPITNLNFSFSGPSNILTPNNNASLDPNHCTGNNSSISPGGSCVFYLKLSSELLSVGTESQMQINVDYSVNNSVVGDLPTNLSSGFNLYEIPNLYIMQNNGTLWMYNASYTTSGQIESVDTNIINSMVVDTNSYGLLYFATNTGIYSYGQSNNNPSGQNSHDASNNIAVSGLTGATNLVTALGSMYMSGTNSNGIWAYSLSSESFLNNNWYYGLNASTESNVNAVSDDGTVYFVTQNNKIYSCAGAMGSSCNKEGDKNLQNNNNTINTIAIISPSNSLYTGLFVGTQNGLFAESSESLGVHTPTSSNVTWIKVESISTAILANAVTNGGALLVGGYNGTIYRIGNDDINQAPTVFASSPNGTPITNMLIDSASNTLYFVSGNSDTGYGVFSCSITDNCSKITNVLSVGSVPVVGMAIGSSLTNTTSNPGTL